MERKEKMKKKKSALRLFLAMTFTCLLLPIGVTGCSSDDENEISFWDENSPEEILEELADVPAYVETIDELSSGIYTYVHYHKYHPNNAELLDAAINSGDYSEIRTIVVETEKLRMENIPFHSKVLITASVTSRCRINADYMKQKTGFADTGWLNFANKAYLHKISERN
ncbi:MAG: hypothetical protein II934_07745 [Prevotella sp.]|nr:hypothetical protein [Prevotella sp.]